MKFGSSLESSIYSPWKDSYLNYTELKTFLYEGQSGEPWGERLESRFVEKLDSELEKVVIMSIEYLTIRYMLFNTVLARNWRRRSVLWRPRLRDIRKQHRSMKGSK